MLNRKTRFIIYFIGLSVSSFVIGYLHKPKTRLENGILLMTYVYLIVISCISFVELFRKSDTIVIDGGTTTLGGDLDLNGNSLLLPGVTLSEENSRYSMED